MPAPYHPLALANEFIALSGNEGVQHMKLQKLVYCAHGWWLAAHPGPIVNEDPQVWRHGPVFPSLYRALSGFGSEYIRTTRPLVGGATPIRIDDEDDESYQMILFVWGRYGRKSSWELSDMTHKVGTPWQITAEQNNFRVPRNTVIERQLIREEFQRIRDRELVQAG